MQVRALAPARRRFGVQACDANRDVRREDLTKPALNASRQRRELRAQALCHFAFDVP